MDHLLEPVPLRLLSETGEEIRPVSDADGVIINGHSLVVDATHNRAYLVGGLSSNRVTSLDFLGRKLWQVEELAPPLRRATTLATDSAGTGTARRGTMPLHAVCLDPKTGHIWGTFSIGAAPLYEYGLTQVFDTRGNQVATLPLGGVDIAYDSRGDGFWLVNSAIVRLSREGKTLFRIPSKNAAFHQLSIDPRDGSAWVVEADRERTKTSETKVRHVDAQGKMLSVWKKAGLSVTSLACDPKTGIVWIAGGGDADLLRLAPDGKELAPLEIRAMSLSISPTTGRIWVATATEILQLDHEGKTIAHFPFKSPTSYTWVGAF